MVVESFKKAHKKERKGKNCEGSEIKVFLKEIIMHYLKVGTAIPFLFVFYSAVMKFKLGSERRLEQSVKAFLT